MARVRIGSRAFRVGPGGGPSIGDGFGIGAVGGPVFDFYVDPAGSDSNAGTLAAPFATIAKAMSSATSLLKRVGLKRGTVFRETATISQDGMTLGAYGGGNRPVINGANLIQSAWTNTPANSGTVSQTAMRMSVVNGTAFVDFGSAGALTPYLGNLLTITDSAGKKLTGYIKAAGTSETFGSELLANTDFATTTSVNIWYNTTISSVAGGQSGNCLRVTQAGGFGYAYQNVTTTSGRLYVSSAYLQKGTETGVQHFGIYTSGPGSMIREMNSSPATFTLNTLYFTAAAASYAQVYGGEANATYTQFDTASVKQVLTPSATGVTITSTSGGSTFNWASEDVGFNRNDASGYSYAVAASGSATNVWQTTLTTQPKIVAFNGVGNITAANLAGVDGAGKWFWSTNVLYVYSTSDPATAFTSVEAGFRNNAVALNSKNTATISGLDIRFTNAAGITSSVTANTGIVVDGCAVYYTGGAGIAAYTGSLNWTISSNTLTYCGGGQGGGLASGDAIYTLGEGGTGSGFTVRDNVANNNYGNGLLIGGTNNVISGNSIANNGNSGFGYGIETLGGGNDIYNNVITGSNATWGAITLVAGNSNKVHHNRIYANNGTGIVADGGTDHWIGYNVIYGHLQNNGYGIHLASGGNNTLISNNTCSGNQAGVFINNTVTGAQVRNNSLTSNVQFGYGSAATVTITNNDSWGNTGSNYYLTADQTGSNGNISADPKFTNGAGFDFSLQATSPLIGAGVTIAGGSPYDRAISAGSSWPNGVGLVAQATLWNVGAYA